MLGTLALMLRMGHQSIFLGETKSHSQRQVRFMSGSESTVTDAKNKCHS